MPSGPVLSTFKETEMSMNTTSGMEVHFDVSCPRWLHDTVQGCLLTLGNDPFRTGRFLAEMKSPHRDFWPDGPIYTLRSHGMVVEFDSGSEVDGTLPFCKVSVQDYEQPSTRRTLVQIVQHQRAGVRA